MEGLAVFGLGYVGREVAALALDRGIDVYGVDIDESVVAAVESDSRFTTAPGTIQVSTDGDSVIDNVQFVVIAVPTPLSSKSLVDLTPLKSVCRDIADQVTSRDTPLSVVVESTIPPGTVSDVVIPIFESQNLTIGEDVYIAHAPERIDPGNNEWPIESLPRVVGAVSEDGANAIVGFYERLLDAEVHRVENPSVAAASKIIENTYRDINIAYVNEIALTLDQLDIDVEDALDAAETKPFGFTRFSPGAGVGGHCIPIDPYFLIEKASDNGFENRFLNTARDINNRMPKYVAQKTIRSLIQEETLPQNAKGLLLGKAFKPGVEDTRNSPYFKIRDELKSYDMAIETYDPQLPSESTADSVYTNADVAVLVTAHPEFRNIDFDHLAENNTRLLVDGRNIYNPAAVEEAGITYVGMGR
ncbi:nucleotide sugar dehydrogenase [Salinibaculum rarum]|uniref:nucleotide sugar dehydrogenase n=1 Tax=Salinibaculum rarum TaxID=3058903 RepID=UPI00265DB3F2|nr:nucleotide sugar dehydrogenase [Salinibaculum sp. KK48]